MFAQLIHAFQEQIDRQRIPGALLWVARSGQPLLCRALGRLDPARPDPMREDAIFRIYSMTKPITSVGIMLLVEEGVLDLDAPARRYLPEMTSLQVGVEHDAGGRRELVLRAAVREMTVRDLLRHTAGLTYGFFESSLVKDEYIRSGVESRRFNNQEFVRRLAALPLAYEPGTTWEYSRATDVLGALIERLAGRTLGDFLAERIFAPLGMVDTGFWVPLEKAERIAEPFSIDPDSGAEVRVISIRSQPVFESGGGGLVSTLADYVRFQNVLRNLGQAGATRLLREETVREMTRDHLGTLDRGLAYLPGPDYGFGLGVAVRLKDGPYGKAGEYFWPGVAGTHQWIDHVQDVSAVLLLQAPGQRDSLRSLFYQEVYRGLAAA